jgi:DUF2934 family protein
MLQDREQAVRERAYALWERDGRPEDRSLAHWCQAEAGDWRQSGGGVSDKP